MENYYFTFKFNELDNQYYAYLCDKTKGNIDDDNTIRGKELKKFIEENYKGDNFSYKYKMYKIEETSSFIRFCEINNIKLRWSNFTAEEKINYLESGYGAIDFQ